MQGAVQQRGSIPEEIKTPRAKLVYFTLEVTEGASVPELQEICSLRKLTLLSILDSLSKQSLVEYTGSKYRTVESDVAPRA